MTLFSTKYDNIQRTVAGTYSVDPEDVILLCNTTDAAVIINLAEIPANRWNTVYKLYVKDNTGNAATNNITISAPAGFTINGASSITISTNSAHCVIRISSNTTYQSSNSWSTSGSGLIIQNEGVNLPEQPTLNFIGSEVVAENDSVNNRINVTVGATGNRVVAVKATTFTPDVRIPSIPISTGQSWVIANTSSVIIDNWRQTVSSLGGFNPTTGAWTVPNTGNYNVRLRLIIGAFNDGGLGLNDNAKYEEGDFGRGTFLLCFICPATSAIAFVEQFTAYGTAPVYTGTANAIRSSVIVIDRTVLKSPFTAGHVYYVKVLNKTELGYLISPDNSVSIHQSLSLTIDETT